MNLKATEIGKFFYRVIKNLYTPNDFIVIIMCTETI